jgi:hypothetical protein
VNTASENRPGFFRLNPTQTNSEEIGFAENSGLKTGLKNPLYSKSWNWGAFWLNAIWLMNHGKLVLGLAIFVLSFVPLLGPCILLGSACYVGVKGNDIAYNNRKFVSIEQYVDVQDAWQTWGFAFISAIILGVIICLISNPISWFASAHWPRS